MEVKQEVRAAHRLFRKVGTFLRPPLSLCCVQSQRICLMVQVVEQSHKEKTFSLQRATALSLSLP